MQDIHFSIFLLNYLHLLYINMPIKFTRFEYIIKYIEEKDTKQILLEKILKKRYQIKLPGKYHDKIF